MITTYYRFYDGQAETCDCLCAGFQRFVEKFNRQPEVAYVPAGELDGVVKAMANRIGVTVKEDELALPGTVAFWAGVTDHA